MKKILLVLFLLLGFGKLFAQSSQLYGYWQQINYIGEEPSISNTMLVFRENSTIENYSFIVWYSKFSIEGNKIVISDSGNVIGTKTIPFFFSIREDAGKMYLILHNRPTLEESFMFYYYFKTGK